MTGLSTNSGLCATVKSGFFLAYGNKMEYKNFAQRLNGLRLEKGIKSQKNLAEWLGVSTSIVSEWIRDEKIPSHETAIMIANKFNCSIEWLMTGRGSKEIKESSDPFYAMYLQLPEQQKVVVQNLVQSLSQMQTPENTQNKPLTLDNKNVGGGEIIPEPSQPLQAQDRRETTLRSYHAMLRQTCKAR
jgi:transcriptional regulator with XRE-family HTH domain